MIQVIEIDGITPAPVAGGTLRTIIGPATHGTRVEVAMREVAAGQTANFRRSDRTQVAYIVDGDGATISHTAGGRTTDHPAPRRSGIYLEPGEEAAVQASGSALKLLLVSVPKHTGKAGGANATGYFFEEAALRSLLDERSMRERTFWVNKETGLSDSWDLQLGRMRYEPRAYSPRHVHSASAISPVTPEHFYLIERGTGEVKHDTGSEPLGPGSFVLIPAGDWHSLISSDSGFDYIEFQAPFDFVTTMDHDPLGKNWYIKGTDDGTGKPKLWVQS